MDLYYENARESFEIELWGSRVLLGIRRMRFDLCLTLHLIPPGILWGLSCESTRWPLYSKLRLASPFLGIEWVDYTKGSKREESVQKFFSLGSALLKLWGIGPRKERMLKVETYQAIEKTLRDFVVHRVFLHTEQEFSTDYPMSYGEMDRFLEDIDQARQTPEEPGNEEEEPDNGEELEGLPKALLGNVGQYMPMLATIFMAPRLDAFIGALKATAHADVIRAIIDCRRVMLETSGSQWGDEILDYVEALKELEKNLAAEPGESDQESEPAKE